MKKVVISFISVILIYPMAFSTTAFACIYTEENLPYGVQSELQQERELSNDIKEEIVEKLIETEYSDSNPDDIVVRYYGTLSNGAMLINHYNENYEYTENFHPDNSYQISYNNVTFFYRFPTNKDKVNLYINGDFYTFKEAYDTDLIDFKNLWEIEHLIDNFVFGLGYFPEYREEGNVLFGDVNGDRYITISDATMIQKYLSVLCELNDDETECADFNDDGEINIIDVTLLQNTLARGSVR